jgi:hypothetical protein
VKSHGVAEYVDMVVIWPDAVQARALTNALRRRE